eukprot:Skav222903  [mRNA]  locus=scaffold1489:82225:90509:+ [translate_table: standard]
MSLRMLQKKVLLTWKAADQFVAVTQTTSLAGGRNKWGGGGGGGGGYYSSAGDASQTSNGGGGYYDNNKAPGRSSACTSPGIFADENFIGFVASPGVAGGFRGSDAQRAHVEAMRSGLSRHPPPSDSRPQVDVLQEVADEQALAECILVLFRTLCGPRLQKHVLEAVDHRGPIGSCCAPMRRTVRIRATSGPKEDLLVGEVLKLGQVKVAAKARPRTVPKAAPKAPAAAPAPEPETKDDQAQRMRATKKTSSFQWKGFIRKSSEIFSDVPAVPEAAEVEEIRLDPESGKEVTFQQLQEMYKAYWASDCEPVKKVPKPATEAAPAPVAPPSPQPSAPETAQRKTRRF